MIKQTSFSLANARKSYLSKNPIGVLEDLFATAEPNPHGSIADKTIQKTSKGIYPSKKYADIEPFRNFISPGYCMALSTLWLQNRKKAYSALIDFQGDKKKSHTIKLQYPKASSEFNSNLDFQSSFWKQVCKIQENTCYSYKNKFFDDDLGYASQVILSKSKQDFQKDAVEIFLFMLSSRQEIAFDLIESCGHACAVEWKINKTHETFDVTFFEANTAEQVLKTSISLNNLHEYLELIFKTHLLDQDFQKIEYLEQIFSNNLKDFLDKSHFFSKQYSFQEPILQHCIYFQDSSISIEKTPLHWKMLFPISSLNLEEKNALFILFAKYHNTIMAQECLRHGAVPDAASFHSKYTSLLYACQSKDDNMVKILLRHGANPNISSTEESIFPLYLAAQHGFIEIVKILLQHGAHVNMTRKDNASSLLISAQNGHTEIVQILLSHGAQTDIFPNSKFHPLLQAVKRKHNEIVDLLLNHNTSTIDVEDKAGATPLLTALHNGDILIAKKLIEKGANVNLPNYEGITPLTLAVTQNKLGEIVQLLISRGANIDMVGKCQCSPLYMACQSGQTETVAMLLAYGANPNIANSWGSTPLHCAVSLNHSEIEHKLLAHGADATLINHHGISAMMLMEKRTQASMNVDDNGSDKT